MAITPFKSSDNFNMAGFNEKITEADNTYVAKTGGGMTGALSMGNNKITDVASPVADTDATTKEYVDKEATNGLFGYTKLCTLNSTNPVPVNMKFEKLHSIIFIVNCTVNIENNTLNKILFKVGSNVGAQFALFGNDERNGVVAKDLLLIRYPQTYEGFNSSSSIYFNEGLVYSDYVSGTFDSVSCNFSSFSGTIDIYTKYYN